MCTILTSTGKELPAEFLENIVNSNGDGAGFSYFKDGAIHIEKGFFDFASLYEAYKKTIGCPIIVHARFATSGAKNEANCHPFVISDRLHFCHNGVLHYFSSKFAGMSDTFGFGEIILKGFDNDNPKRKWWRNKGFLWFVKNAIGKGNKLALLDNEGKIEIINEESGEWIEEGVIWASNGYYKEIKERFTNNNINNSYFGPNPHRQNSGTGGGLIRIVNHPVDPDFPEHDSNEDNVVDIENELDAADRMAETLRLESEAEDFVNLEEIPADELEEVDHYLDTINATSK